MFIFNTAVNKATPCTGSSLQPEPAAGKSASQPCRKQINLPTLLPESGEVKKRRNLKIPFFLFAYYRGNEISHDTKTWAP